MAWRSTFILAGVSCYFFDAQIARQVPFLTSRYVMLGSLVALAAAFAVHVFERSPR
jgi:hypothetical protein